MVGKEGGGWKSGWDGSQGSYPVVRKEQMTPVDPQVKIPFRLNESWGSLGSRQDYRWKQWDIFIVLWNLIQRRCEETCV